MKKQKKNLYEEGDYLKAIRENPWIVSTFVLGFLCLGLIISSFIPQGLTDKMGLKEDICSSIKVTPTWIQGNVTLGEGATNFGNPNSSKVVDDLIKEEVFFVYHSGCGACNAQIKYFNDSWNKYVDSGLTIDCKK